MKLPYRKPGKYATKKKDPNITQDKFNELQKTLEQLQLKLPHARSEVARLAELGDFSENVEYQMAKGRLRGINSRILKTENELRNAVIIEPDKSKNIVQLGSKVLIEIDGKEKTFTILGSTEADPLKGIISQNSPIGSALLGKKLGDEVEMELAKGIVKAIILSLN